MLNKMKLREDYFRISLRQINKNLHLFTPIKFRTAAKRRFNSITLTQKPKIYPLRVKTVR